MVEVDHQQRHRLVRLLAVDQHLLEGFVEVGSVVQAGQAVAAAGVAQPAVGFLQLHQRGADFLGARSEEHTSELQSLMRSSYAVFCLKKKTVQKNSQV